MKVGVIGCGVVGSAVAECFEKAAYPFEVMRYDKFKNIGTLHELVVRARMIFVCVPTETKSDWTQDLVPLNDVLGRLDAMNYTGTVVVKCTVTPGTMDRMRAKYKFLSLVHNPEFLTEANAKRDFMEQKEVLLSGPSKDALGMVAEAYRKALPNVALSYFYDFKTTELAKYIHNCFLATKVAFMNEVFDYAEEIKASFKDSVEAAARQGVIGTSHLKVPGPDGKRGFGGMCFPKDTKALVNSDDGMHLTILARVIASNAAIRPEGV